MYLPYFLAVYIAYTLYMCVCVYMYIHKIGSKGWLGLMDLWSGIKSWWNWYLTHVVNFGEVQGAQLAKSTISPPHWCPLDLFRSFKVCSDANANRVQKAMGSYRTYSIHSKTVDLVPEFAVEDLASAKLQALVPALAVKDLPLGTTLMIYNLRWFSKYFYEVIVLI